MIWTQVEIHPTSVTFQEESFLFSFWNTCREKIIHPRQTRQYTISSKLLNEHGSSFDHYHNDFTFSKYIYSYTVEHYYPFVGAQYLLYILYIQVFLLRLYTSSTFWRILSVSYCPWKRITHGLLVKEYWACPQYITNAWSNKATWSFYCDVWITFVK